MKKKTPSFFFFFFCIIKNRDPFHHETDELFELSRERERETETKTSRQNIVLKSSSSRENKVPFSRLKRSRRHGSLDDHKKGAGGESPKERRLVFCLLDFLLAFCALFF